MKKLIFLFTLLCVSLSTRAYDFTVGGIYYNITSTSPYKVEVTSMPYTTKYSYTVSIPSSVVYSGISYSVTAIGNGAFQNCPILYSILMPNSIVSIGGGAFNSCTGLKTVAIPSSVLSIGGGAFDSCTGLTTISIPSSVTSIGVDAFRNCLGLISVTLGNSITTIGGGSFAFCTGLTAISIPSSVTSIGEDAFLNCISLTSLTLEDSLISIGKYAFSNCTGLTAITIGNSVKSIGEGAFKNCSSLINISFNANDCSIMGSLDQPVFENCQNVNAIAIGDNVSRIPNYTFITTMSAVKSITIPNSVTVIGEYAFSGFNSIKSIIIPSSVTTIDHFAFANCANLSSIIIPNSVISVGSGTFYNTPWYNNHSDGLIYAGKIAYQYKGTMPNFTNIDIIEGTNGISDMAFAGSGLYTITIPSSVKSIGYYAFNDCTLYSVTIKALNLPVMGSDVFYNCSKVNLIVTTGKLNLYQSAPQWKEFKSMKEMSFSPAINTMSISNITANSALTGGDITYDGGASITEKGVCWGITTNPTINNNKTTNGTSVGSFTSYITGLSSGTIYYIRAYATNSVGTSYGENIVFKTPTSPTIIGAEVTSITTTTATSGGTVSSDGGSMVTARGVCWSTTENPTISNNKTSDGTGTGSFTSSITGLSQSNSYYVRAYATNSIGTSYGNNIIFHTPFSPMVTTTIATSISSTTAISGGDIILDGGAIVTARGVCWSKNIYPTINNSKTSDGTGAGTFTSSITGLVENTTYHYRAYATNSVGTSYGTDLTLTTSIVYPTVTTTTATSVSTSGAISGGTISSDGGTTVSARGICWSTSANPTISNSKTTDGAGIGTYTSSITGLAANTTYHYRAYASNSSGTSYGSDLTFTTQTSIVAPTLTTKAVSSITVSTAISGGTITSDGNATVTTRGVCWSTAANPTISDIKTIDGTGIGTYTSSITGLKAGTTYHVRAYATNSVNTSYGEDLTFTTLPTPTNDVDVTNTNLTNPGFDISCNYLYNATAANLAAANGTANDLTVTGWTMTANSWTAAAAFECGYTGKLNNSTVPALASDGKSTGSGVGVLGVNAGWGGKAIYYQSVTLPAGKYKIIYTACNSSSSPAAISKVGWTTSATDSILSTVTSFPQNVWMNDTIPFTLTATTSGSILVGMQSQNTSSGSNGKIFFDYIKLIKIVNQTAPTITTTAASSILAKSASSGGNITSDGGTTVTVRGVCWSTTANPTTINSKTSDGTGIGQYTSSITGLLPLTTYHIRAYATNLVGTSYGSDITFTTLYNTALNDVQTNDVDIYPNPSNGILNVKLENYTPSNTVVSLFNMVGQKVYTQSINAPEIQINLSGYNFKGVYLITIESEKGKICSDRKIVFK